MNGLWKSSKLPVDPREGFSVGTEVAYDGISELRVRPQGRRHVEGESRSDEEVKAKVGALRERGDTADWPVSAIACSLEKEKCYPLR